VPLTVAAHCEVAPGATLDGVHAADTDVMVDEDEDDCTVMEVEPAIWES